MARPRKQATTAVESSRRAIIYLRVSTTEQADSGLGLAAQESRCRAYCVSQGWEVRGVYVDAGVSAKSLDRPKLQEALAALETGDMLVVLKLDRLTRRVPDLDPLIQRIEGAGASWASVSESFDSSSACGRLMVNLMLCLSQWERETIGERTAQALGVLKEQGVKLGAPATGFRVVHEVIGTNAKGEVMVKKSLEVNETEMAAVVRAKELRVQNLTFHAICDTLTAEGYRPKRGERWFPATVSRMIERG